MKYFIFFRIGLRQALSEKGSLIGFSVFYCAIMLIFSRIWAAAYEQPTQVLNSTALQGNSIDMLWYLAVTEWILISTPMAFLQIEKDVRSGDIAYQLNRPVSYLGTKISEAMGILMVRWVVLAPIGILCAWLLSGSLPTNPENFWIVLPLSWMAGVLGILFQTLIGLSAFWILEATPVFWIWQKAGFVLGGLMLPLSLYPKWLLSLAQWTPFSAMLCGPAQIMIHQNTESAFVTFFQLLIWSGIALFLLKWVFGRASAIIEIHGG